MKTPGTGLLSFVLPVEALSCLEDGLDPGHVSVTESSVTVHVGCEDEQSIGILAALENRCRLGGVGVGKPSVEVRIALYDEHDFLYSFGYFECISVIRLFRFESYVCSVYELSELACVLGEYGDRVADDFEVLCKALGICDDSYVAYRRFGRQRCNGVFGSGGIEVVA